MEKETKTKLLKDLKKAIQGDPNESSDEWELNDKQIDLVMQRIKPVIKNL